MFSSIQTELDAVTTKMEKDFKLRAGHLSKFTSLELDQVESFLRPALVILPIKLLKGCTTKMVTMASVVQFIHLAQVIHNRIPDDCPKEDPQFPVLVGDYLFSKFFQYLSTYNMLEWLHPLASIICEMNEGGIIRREVLDKGNGTEKDYLTVVKQEYGLLAAEACKIGAVISQAQSDMKEALEQFGLNIGMAWGIIKENLPLSPQQFLDRAQELVSKLPVSPERDVMLGMVEHLKGMAPSKRTLINTKVIGFRL